MKRTAAVPGLRPGLAGASRARLRSGTGCAYQVALVIGVSLWAGLGHGATRYTRTWHLMPTGNGHGFQVFDRREHRIKQFLEHPYRYVAPGDAGRSTGVGRRNLAHDIYFGLRVDGDASWIDGQWQVEYQRQTHIVHGTSTHAGTRVDTYYFSPFGYGGNAMVMVLKVHNETGRPVAVSMFAKPNLKLGRGRVNPTDAGEHIVWNGDARPPHAVETGPGGGHALYVPLGAVQKAGCGNDGVLYNRVRVGGNTTETPQCQGNSQVFVPQRDVELSVAETAVFGMAILFVNDNPADPQAAAFRDARSPEDTLQQWLAFAGDKDAETLHQEALDEFASWRAAAAPADLNHDEKRLWRQSEAVLRMGQVREPRQDNRDNDGMILASLAPGEWHTGWVRDAAYAITALAMTGHAEEAQHAVDFFIAADGQTQGFFQASTLR